MASTIHSAPLPHAPPSFSRNSTGSSMNGLQLSQSHLGLFDTSQSVASTPAATTPPRGSQQQQLSFGMGASGMPDGIAPGGGSFGTYNSYGQQMHYPPVKPQIYTAVYSSVSVYEMEVNGIAAMRRRSDSWLNATQILKVAGVEKGKRTKVLEKEILNGEHEKVQGGYGKYQGTWVNYRRGVEFCRQYGVEELLRPLLEYDMGQDGMNAAGYGGMETPTKEQAMAAQRKRLYTGVESRPMGQSSNGTFFKNISSTAANAVNAINKARFDSPAPRTISASGRHNTARRQSSQQIAGSQESTFPGGSQQSMHSMASETSFTGSVQNGGSFYMSNAPDHVTNGDVLEPPRKRMRPSSSQEHYLSQGTANLDHSMSEATPTEPNDSFFYPQTDPSLMMADESVIGLHPLSEPQGPIGAEKIQLLTSLFMDPTQTDFSDHAALLTLSGEDLELPLDGSSNNALHWAATLARIPLVKALIARGVSIFRLNSGGQTALTRACIARNNMDFSTFPELLELLGASIEIRDNRGRTVLHHIAISTAIRGRSHVGRYYLESLLEYVVRSGSATSSQQNSFNNGSQLPIKTIGLARFMSEIVNAQDKMGDTALNLAARTTTRSIIQQLLEVGADPNIANHGGLKPSDFGIGAADGEMQNSNQQLVRQDTFGGGGENALIATLGDTHQEIMSSISDALTQSQEEFTTELRSKQDELDAINTKLREASSALAEDRRQLSDLQRTETERTELEQKIGNLRRSASELRAKLSQQNGINGNKPKALVSDVRVGAADAGLEVDPDALAALFANDDDSDDPMQPLSEQQIAFLSSLKPAQVLKGRVKAYKEHNETLERTANQLKSRSNELEARYRRIVSLSTGVSETQIDSVLGGLVQAVMSEEGADVGRIRDFLRMVRDT